MYEHASLTHDFSRRGKIIDKGRVGGEGCRTCL